jgi:ATP-binding cassette subfamily C protein CydD
MSADTRASSRWLYALGRRAAGRVGLTVAVGWLIGLAAVGQALLLARLIHAIVIDGRPVETLGPDFGSLAIVLAGRALLTGLREITGFAAGARVRETVRMELVDRIFAAGPVFTRREESGALGSVLLEQVEALQDFYALFLPQLALAVLVPLTIAAAVFPVSWAAGALLLVTAPAIPFFTVLVGMGAESISQRHFESLARMSAHFLDVLRGLATLKLFGRSREQRAEIARVSAEYRRRTMSVLRVAFLSSAVLEFFASLSIALVAVYLGMGFLGYFQFGAYGQPLTLADGLFVLLLAPEFYLPLRELGAHYHARAQAIGAAERLRAVAEAPVTATAAGGGRPLPAGRELRVRCVNLEFGYGEGRMPAVRGASLDLRTGKSVALVGGSGAGKSTLLFLLMGFLQPQRGEIRVGELPLAQADPFAWRRRIGWLGQNPVLFSGSIAENIRLGRAAASPEEIREAAARAGVLEFARQLPEGLETHVGELGVGLSRGQAQRVALARALLRDAPLLLLDEPTAGLDAETERRVLDAVDRLREDRAILTVTHRLADIRRADRIYVMENGRIVEEGSPAELDAARGAFHRLRRPPGGGFA